MSPQPTQFYYRIFIDKLICPLLGIMAAVHIYNTVEYLYFYLFEYDKLFVPKWRETDFFDDIIIPTVIAVSFFLLCLSRIVIYRKPVLIFYQEGICIRQTVFRFFPLPPKNSFLAVLYHIAALTRLICICSYFRLLWAMVTFKLFNTRTYYIPYADLYIGEGEPLYGSWYESDMTGNPVRITGKPCCITPSCSDAAELSVPQTFEIKVHEHSPDTVYKTFALYLYDIQARAELPSWRNNHTDNFDGGAAADPVTQQYFTFVCCPEYWTSNRQLYS